MGLTRKVDIFSEKSRGTSQQQGLNEIEQDFLVMLDRWHAHKEVWDDELDAIIYTMNAEILTSNKREFDFNVKRFSPSSANSCQRALYMKMTGAQKDKQTTQPHQGRWRRIGTAVGEMLQRDLMFIEKHYKKELGEEPPFVPQKVQLNGAIYPAWEKFVQKEVTVHHKGYDIPFIGQPDGLLTYKDGRPIGLEIKSLQTTAARSSYYSLREPKEDHIKQVIAYSIMYGVDEFLITYINLAKKAWDMDEETYKKSPDLRAFYVKVTEEDRREVLDYLSSVLEAVEKGEPPKLDLEKWAFNDYKEACAKSLTEEELRELKEEVEKIQKSKLPTWKKENYAASIKDIEKLRSAD